MKYINIIETTKFNNKLINDLSQQLKLSKHFIKLLFARGFKTKNDILNFLNFNIDNFHNPFLLKGMKEGVNVIKNAIKNKKKITIVGDYDTDGICATAILYKYFESIGVKVDYFLPNRFADGYGLTIDSIDKIVKDFNPHLIITVDCGIACCSEIDYAKSLGIDVLVTDHHEIPEQTPSCVCINPKAENKYPFNELCGAGVALKLVHALAGLQESLKYCSIASLATVADIVPLVDENRTIVKYGLKNQSTLPIGVKKLIEALKIKSLTSIDIAFKVAPKLNTAGRMGDASLAFALFIEKNPVKITEILTELEEQNTNRVEAGNMVYNDCINKLSNICVSKLRCIVLYSPDWHVGVIGIACSKLVEKFNRPVCLITKVGKEYKGSIRSIDGINIYQELSKVSDLLVKFGGHSAAGGLTVKNDCLNIFKKQLNNNIAKNYPDSIFEQVKYYDFDANKEKVTIAFLKELAQLEPLGHCNEKPIFKYTFNNVKPERLKKYPNYLKFKTDNFEMMAFNISEYYDSLNTNCNKNVLLDFNIDTYKQRNKVNAVIKHISLESLNSNINGKVVMGYYAKQLTPAKSSNNPIIREININKLKNIINSDFGTLFIANSFESYTFAIKNLNHLIKNYESFSIKNLTSCNTLLYLAKNTNNFNAYHNIVFLDEVINKEYLYNFKNNVNIMAVNKGGNVLKDLQTDRNIFAHYHKALLVMNKKNLFSYSEQEYFNLLTKQNKIYNNFTFNQFIFITQVLAELNIIEIVDELDLYKININKNIFNALTNSKIYNFVKLHNTVS